MTRKASKNKEWVETPSPESPSRKACRVRRWTRSIGVALAIWLVGTFLAIPVPAQTITVVGTRHLTGMLPPANEEQLAHTVTLLSAFEPTQVCVERMSGERIEHLLGDPARHGFTFQPERHGRALAPTIVPIGIEQQLMMERRPADARLEASELIGRWSDLDTAKRIHAIGLQIAGFEFHSAVLNWSWLDDEERDEARRSLGANSAEALDQALSSAHEAYALGVPLARQAGLHELCTADSQEDESAGMLAALRNGGEAVLENPRVKARFDELIERSEAAWRAESGPGALTAMLRFFNSEEYGNLDRRLQWETLREFDNEEHAFHRRLMFWHARTAEISAELLRALAHGPKERVLFIVGSAHRPFTEAALRAQPWIEVTPALELLEPK